MQGVRGEEIVNKALPSLEGLPEVYTYIHSRALGSLLTDIAERGVQEQHHWVLACPLEFRASVSHTQPQFVALQRSC